MPSLRETQCEISRAIRSESGESAAMLVRNDGIEPAQRLQIYRNNHRLGSRATLQAAYPVIERLGGAEWFRQSAACYIAAHPSTSGDLQNLGEHYPAFLRTVLADTAHAYFSDIASLEWAHQCVLTAADRPPAALDALRAFAADDYPRLVFIPRPALRVVTSPYPLLTIWQANQPHATEADADAEIRLDGGESHVLLIRRRDHVELRNLCAGSCALLREFLRSRPLAAAATAAAETAVDFDLNASLTEIVRLETIADIDLNPAPDGEYNPRRTH